MESQAAAQWVALGGATLLLIWLLRFAAKYQSIMTSGAYRRITALEQTVERLDQELWAERKRCDDLMFRVAVLQRQHPPPPGED
jgi:predicted oxidoreductase